MEYFPIPSFTAPDGPARTKQIENYLYMLRERLEMAFTDISTENLSPAFRRDLQSLGLQLSEARAGADERDQRVEQISNRQLAASDVLNGGTGYIQTYDGTLVCYGTGAASVAFPRAYAQPPVVLTNTAAETVVTESGFTTDASGFSWVSIGRRAE